MAPQRGPLSLPLRELRIPLHPAGAPGAESSQRLREWAGSAREGPRGLCASLPGALTASILLDWAVAVCSDLAGLGSQSLLPLPTSSWPFLCTCHWTLPAGASACLAHSADPNTCPSQLPTPSVFSLPDRLCRVGESIRDRLGFAS